MGSGGETGVTIARRGGSGAGVGGRDMMIGVGVAMGSANGDRIGRRRGRRARMGGGKRRRVDREEGRKNGRREKE